MRHIVFFIGYLFFLAMDLRRKEIDLTALAVYAFVSLVTVTMTKNDITLSGLVDIIFSIAFGLVIYLLSYFSRGGIGLADGIYFVINGLLLTLKENILLFLTGLMVAFIIGIFLVYFGNENSRKNSRLPFIPCFLPAIIGYIICIV